MEPSSDLAFTVTVSKRQPDPFEPLAFMDVAAFGRHLFGSRWRTPMAKKLGISRQMIDHWCRNRRRISGGRSRQMTVLVGQRQRRHRAAYTALVNSVSSTSARELLFKMLADDIDIRVQAMRLLLQPSELADRPIWPQEAPDRAPGMPSPHGGTRAATQG